MVELFEESFKHLYDVTSSRHRVKQNSWDGKVEVRVVRPLVVGLFNIHANGHTRTDGFIIKAARMSLKNTS